MFLRKQLVESKITLIKAFLLTRSTIRTTIPYVAATSWSKNGAKFIKWGGRRQSWRTCTVPMLRGFTVRNRHSHDKQTHFPWTHSYCTVGGMDGTIRTHKPIISNPFLYIVARGIENTTWVDPSSHCRDPNATPKEANNQANKKKNPTCAGSICPAPTLVFLMKCNWSDYSRW